MLFLCLVAPFVVSLAASAKTWQVRKDGLGHATVIQDAVDMAAPGDTVLIHPGRYLEYEPYDYGALTVDTYAIVTISDLTIRGTDRASVIIGPDEYLWESRIAPVGVGNISTASNTQIGNLTIENVVQGIVFNGSGVASECTMRGNYLGFACWSDQPSRLEDSSILDPLDKALWCQSHKLTIAASTFEGRRAKVVISQADGVIVEDSEFSELAFLQFQMFASGTVRRCQFIGGARIVSFDSVTMIEESVIMPGPHFAIYVGGGNVTLTRNVLQNSGGGTVVLFGRSDTIARQNHILPGEGPSVNLQFYGATGHTVDFRNNWWGSTDSTQIAAWILDANDEPDRGEVVDFWPILDAPVPVQPGSIGSLKSKF